MELQSISRQSLGVSQLVRAQVGSGRIALPVSSNRIYANFRHITGVGGTAGMPAFSLSQLRNLDNLIDRLKLLKGESVSTVDLNGVSPDDIGGMIEQYQQELHSELQKQNPYRTGVSASGISLNILA